MRKKQTSSRRAGRVEIIRQHYEPRIAPGRPSHEVLDWISPATQEARFAVLADNVNLNGKGLLDVGCGLGDLRAYLLRRGVAVDYTGVDVSARMVQEASARQPGGKFLEADVFAEPSPFAEGSFDVAYCSGLFNLDLGNNRQFVPQAVRTFLRLARQCVVVNMLHNRAGEGDGTYFYYDPHEVVPQLRKLAGAKDIRLLDDYLHNDFTVICYK